jgi:hypothetical protein
MHRRPLGRGRTLAALATPLLVIGCVLPWWQVGGTPGIPVETGNGLAGSAILVFMVGIASLALVALPYAAGDRPVGLDRWLSFAILAVAGWVGFAWRIFTNGPGLWLAGLGLVVLSRAVYEMAREPSRR